MSGYDPDDPGVPGERLPDGHDLGDGCWCKPTRDGSTVIHRNPNQKEEHQRILGEAFIETVDHLDHGGIGLDPKRPFGQRSVANSVGEILCLEEEGEDGGYTRDQEEYLQDLYDDLPKWLCRTYKELKAAADRVKDLEELLHGVLRMEDLIAPGGDVKPEHEGEAHAIQAMLQSIRTTLKVKR